MSWTKPEELDYAPGGPFPPLGHVSRHRFYLVTCGGFYHSVRNDFKHLDLAINPHAVKTFDGWD